MAFRRWAMFCIHFSIAAVLLLAGPRAMAQELTESAGDEGQMCDTLKGMNLPSCSSADDLRTARSPVCGTDNRTYPSQCHLERAAAAAEACSGVTGNGAGSGIPGMGPQSQPLAIKHRGRCRGSGSRSMKRPLESEESGAAGGARKKGGGRQAAPRKNPCLSDQKYAREMQYRLRKQEMERQQQQLGGKGRLRAGKERRRQDSTQTPTTSGSIFLPVCLSDGNYAPVQCHQVTGYCWCVSPEGRPYPDTSVQHKKPKCRQGKSSTHRRNTRGRKQRKGCGRVDRTTFNTNLIKIFRIEYNRLPSKPTSLSYAGIGSSSEDSDGGNGLSEGDRRVLDWKFTSLDSDNDGRLSRAEYRDLRRLVRKAVKPRRCARTFLRSCDLDRDTMISAPEWGACVGLDFNLLSLNSDEGGHKPGELWAKESQERRGRGGKRGGGGGALQGSEPIFSGSREDNFGGADEGEESNCLSDRQAVLEEQNSSSNNYYIPQCAPDGRYQKVQCYKSVGYCWCVHEDTGKPIPGTSTKDQDPKCDSIPVPYRPMKGCPEHKKKEFLKDLMVFLTKKMMLGTGKNNASLSSSTEGKGYNSVEEAVASWNFAALDKNENKVLERKEWKSIRALMATNRALKKCGKKLPRYCDVNNDRRISRTEWLECLNASISNIGKAPGSHQNPLVINVDGGNLEAPIAAALNSSFATTSGPKRKGPNPLEKYLNPDD